MSPFLETWYPQFRCEHCGEPLCWVENPRTGRKYQAESNGNDHRQNPKCPGNQARKTIQRWNQAMRQPPAPEKPTNPRRALEHECAHEGQKRLEAFLK